MKKQIKFLAAALLSLTIAGNTIAGNTPKKESNDFVVNGVINFSGESKESKCKIILYHDTLAVDSVYKKWGKEFEFQLDRNVWYTIKVVREGFEPLMICFNTDLSENTKINSNEFYFETCLISKEDAELYNKENLEFPVGIVAFNNKNGKLEARELYTDHYFTMINKRNTQSGIVMEYVTKRSSK